MDWEAEEVEGVSDLGVEKGFCSISLLVCLWKWDLEMRYVLFEGI